MAAKWYLTAAGRAEFGAKAARRDPELAFEESIADLSVFAQCNARADRARSKALAAETDWWRDAALWIDDEWEVTNKSERLLRTAIQNVFWVCPNADEVWQQVKQGYREALENNWRGVDWQHVKEKTAQSRKEAEAADRAYLRARRINAVIEEARRILRERDKIMEKEKV